MRRLAVLAAFIGSIAAPLCAAGPGDLYSKNGVTGPGFIRSAKCAAIYVVTAQRVGENGEGYSAAVKQGTAWLAWANIVAEGKDATAEMNARRASFTKATAALSPDDLNAVITDELQTCLGLRETYAATEPFGSEFARASGETASVAKPDVNAAIDCAANFGVVAGLLGASDKNYAFYNNGIARWYDYAVSLAGKEAADTVVSQRAHLVNQGYERLMQQDRQAGLARIDADTKRCTALARTVPAFF